jgi:hypothetical protein
LLEVLDFYFDIHRWSFFLSTPVDQEWFPDFTSTARLIEARWPQAAALGGAALSIPIIWQSLGDAADLFRL